MHIIPSSKTVKCFLLFIIFTDFMHAQNVGINTTRATPAATNLLEILSPSTTANSVAVFASHTGVISGMGYGIWA